ncbi:MAG: hypothetical protein ACYDEP_02790 [Acidimicrobiales bacterium]
MQRDAQPHHGFRGDAPPPPPEGGGPRRSPSLAEILAAWHEQLQDEAEFRAEVAAERRMGA